MARHFSHLGHEESQQVFLQSMMNARQKQMMNMQANAAAADPGLTAPVEGVSVEGWAQAAATLGRITDPVQAEQALAQLGMDRAKYERGQHRVSSADATRYSVRDCDHLWAGF